MPLFYRHAPGTIWRRALRRLDRRTATLIAIKADPSIGTGALIVAGQLHLEAVRLSNRLAATCSR